MRHCQFYGVKHLFSVNGCSWWYTHQNSADGWWIRLFQICSHFYLRPGMLAYSTCQPTNTHAHTHTQAQLGYITIWKVQNNANKYFECWTSMWHFLLCKTVNEAMTVTASPLVWYCSTINQSNCLFQNRLPRPILTFSKATTITWPLQLWERQCWEVIIMIVFSVIFLPITSHF